MVWCMREENGGGKGGFDGERSVWMGKLKVSSVIIFCEGVVKGQGFNTVVRHLYIPLYAFELTVISPQ